MNYFMWRVKVCLHKEIRASFLPVGHTKFRPDWCFSLLKQQYRCTNIGCLDDIVQATNISATPNVAQLVGSQNGETIVPTYNWSEYFDQHTIKTALKGIKQMHHFHFSHEFPGQVKVKNDIDGVWSSGNDMLFTPINTYYPRCTARAVLTRVEALCLLHGS